MIIRAKTDVGVKRHTNQDAFAVSEFEDSGVLAVVCDGMGGANAGNVASQKASEVIVSFFERSYRKGLDSAGIIALLKALCFLQILSYTIWLKRTANLREWERRLLQCL